MVAPDVVPLNAIVVEVVEHRQALLVVVLAVVWLGDSGDAVGKRKKC